MTGVCGTEVPIPTHARHPDLRRERRSFSRATSGDLPVDSLKSQIRGLTLHRQDVYARAQAHRQGGQLIPLSLCEELAENGSRLRLALDRYTEETGPSPGWIGARARLSPTPATTTTSSSLTCMRNQAPRGRVARAVSVARSKPLWSGVEGPVGALLARRPDRVLAGGRARRAHDDAVAGPSAGGSGVLAAVRTARARSRSPGGHGGSDHQRITGRQYGPRRGSQRDQPRTLTARAMTRASRAERDERLHCHRDLRPRGERHRVGGTQSGCVRESEIEVVDEARAPAWCHDMRVELLGEGEVGIGASRARAPPRRRCRAPSTGVRTRCCSRSRRSRPTSVAHLPSRSRPAGDERVDQEARRRQRAQAQQRHERDPDHP